MESSMGNTFAENIWQIGNPVPENIEQALPGKSAIFRQLLYNRGIRNEEQAERFLIGNKGVVDPFLLEDMKPAVERILKAIDEREKIAVYGDFDVDGVSATALLVRLIRQMNGQVEGYIPNRFDEGYGLNKEALQTLFDRGVRLVITADCGIRSPLETIFARSIGLDLIISDHHHPQDELPDAVAVICQKRVDNHYPDENLAGVGLAYKIGQALLSTRPIFGVFIEEWLDLVALGTVADVVPLTGENRDLVRQGLMRMHQGIQPGIRSLAGVARKDYRNLNSTDIGFILGPRLNAAGRLQTAMDALNLLLSDDENEIALLAQQLDDQNRRRQEQTRELTASIEAMEHNWNDDKIILVFPEEFGLEQTGLVGLVANRLVDAHHRPAIVGCRYEDCIRASCRSIPKFHITHALDECKDLFVRHGGHAMAAGFTIRTERLQELDDRLRGIAERELRSEDLVKVIQADCELPLRNLKPSLLEAIDALQPTGQGNPSALFVARNVEVLNTSQTADGKHLRLTLRDDRIVYDAIGFSFGPLMDELPDIVDILYEYEKNTYMNRESIQLKIKDIRPGGSAVVKFCEEPENH
jgi:single-stranded-DNA-specific exonuclease